jgi:hypothetical protein
MITVTCYLFISKLCKESQRRLAITYEELNEVSGGDGSKLGIFESQFGSNDCEGCMLNVRRQNYQKRYTQIQNSCHIMPILIK